MTQHKPWEGPLSTWESKAKYFEWLRGKIRQIWSDYPVRNEFKTSKLRPLTQREKSNKLFHPLTKKVGQCVLCDNWFPASKLQVDHIQDTDGCTSFETAEKFLWRMAAEPESNMALVCVPCHKIKSYADKYNLTFEEAVLAKKVIAEENRLGNNAKAYLMKQGYTEGEVSNHSKRRNVIEEIIIKTEGEAQ